MSEVPLQRQRFGGMMIWVCIPEAHTPDYDPFIKEQLVGQTWSRTTQESGPDETCVQGYFAYKRAPPSLGPP